MAAKTQDSKGLGKAQRTSNPLPLPQRLYDLKAAAHYLGRPVWGVRGLVWAGKLPVIRDGRKQYLDVFDMDEYVEKNKMREAQRPGQLRIRKRGKDKKVEGG